MKSIAIIPNPNDGTSFYRGTGVLSELHKADKNMQMSFAMTGDMIVLKGNDFVFFQRPFRQREDLEMVKMCKEMNVPVIVDYDDDFIDIPTNNLFVTDNKNKGNDYQHAVKEILKLADGVIVTTEPLKKKYEEYNKNIAVIPNAWDNYMFPKLEQEFRYNKIILWRGGQSHISDVNVYKDKYNAIIKENRDFRFVFLGDPIVTKEFANHSNVELVSTLPIRHYFQVLKHLAASAFFVPLKDYFFNHCKSNIAKIEASINGALCLAPAWDEWDWTMDDELLYEHPADFYNTANKLIEKIRNKDTSLQTSLVKNQNYIKNITLSEMNEKRINFFKKVLSNV